jgi:protein-disulfide isomerase
MATHTIVSLAQPDRSGAMRDMKHRSFQLAEPLGLTDHVRGPEHAAVTLVEYGDFECPHCKKATGPVKLLLARFGDQVRFAFRPYPLEDVHPHAMRAAEAAECAAAQGRFWEMHDVLFERQEHLETRRLFEYARALGLDMARFTAELEGGIYLQRVRGHQRSGDASGVRATPTFFVNGDIVDVSYGLRSLVDAVEGILRTRTGVKS